MDFSVNLLHTSEKKMKSNILELLTLSKAASISVLSETMLNKLNKPDLIKFVIKFASVCEDNIILCRSAAEKIDELKDNHISCQKELLESQKTQINSVQKVVKTEMKTWSDVVKKNINQNQTQQVNVTKKTMKQVLKSANEEERRSRNVMVYGVAEDLMSYTTEEEKRLIAEGVEEPVGLEDIVQNICQVVGAQFPQRNTEVFRIGKEEAGKTRPVRIEFPDADVARLLLGNAHRLKKTGSYSRVYVAPDRTKEQRSEHSKLVKKLKDMITADPSKHYYIKNGQICKTDKRKDVISNSE